jgi:hypothetical protein
MNTNLTSQFLSASEVSRLSNRPISQITKAIKAGAIAPDSVVLDGRLFLFRADRIEDIKAKLAAI